MITFDKLIEMTWLAVPIIIVFAGGNLSEKSFFIGPFDIWPAINFNLTIELMTDVSLLHL
jgi:hypothetical protein